MNLSNQKEIICNQIKQFIINENLKNIRIYIDDPNNEFLYMSTNLFDREYDYNNTYIYNPNFDNQFDYRDDETLNQADGIILFQQQGSKLQNDISYYMGIFLARKTIFIIFKTVSEYGVYENDSLDFCFNPFISIMYYPSN